MLSSVLVCAACSELIPCGRSAERWNKDIMLLRCTGFGPGGEPCNAIAVKLEARLGHFVRTAIVCETSDFRGVAVTTACMNTQ